MKTSVIWGAGFGAIAALVLGAYFVFEATRGVAEEKSPISQQQEAIVADGQVTDEEQLAAAQAMVSCLRGAGIRVSDPIKGVQGRYEYQYLDGAETREGLEDRNLPVQDCYFKAYSEVDRLRQQSPGVVDSAVELGYAVQICIEDRKPGFQLADNEPELLQQIEVLKSEVDMDYFDCWSGTIKKVFDAAGITQGGVSIRFLPLPR